jgi:lipoprotein-anchoring transpeptidase ErfK/SrfK
LKFPKILLFGAIGLFAVIGAVALFKKKEPAQVAQTVGKGARAPSIKKEIRPEKIVLTQNKTLTKAEIADDFPVIDRMFQLFTTGPTKLPIVETVTYSSSVPWLKGRPAWIADYATYYATSRHFIARGLNGKADYFTQKIAPGSKFNVFRKDKEIHFYLLVDVSRSKMGLYYLDLETKERLLLKTYQVGLGRLDQQSASGSLTPVGIYSLGSKIAVYKPGSTGIFRDQKIEMISVFGTRWIPFHEALEGSPPVKGYGIHGAPWTLDSKTGQFVENRDCLGRYESDGSILLSAEDMEELFSIIITKPSFVVIVKDFHAARLPGIEVATPTR